MIADATARQAGSKVSFVIQIASCLSIVGAVMIAPMLPRIAAEFGSSSPHAAELVPLIASIPSLAILLFAPIAGLLADRFGRKRMLIAGCLVYALVGFLPAILSDLKSILLARLIFGCGEATIMTCCATLIADYWPIQQRAKYLNRQVVTNGVAGALFFTVGGIVGETSWRSPFYLYMLPFFFIPIIAKVLWEPPRRTEVEIDQETFPRREVIRTALSSWFTIFFGMVALFIVPIMTPGILVAIGVTSSSLIGVSTGLELLIGVFGTLSWPYFRKRLGIAGVNTMSLLLVAVGLVILAHAPNYSTVLVAVAVHGFGGGFIVANTMLPLLHKLPVKYRARGLGVYSSFLYLGQFTTPLIIMGIAQRFEGARGIGAAIDVWAGIIAVLGVLWGAGRLPTRGAQLPLDSASSN